MKQSKTNSDLKIDLTSKNLQDDIEDLIADVNEFTNNIQKIESYIKFLDENNVSAKKLKSIHNGWEYRVSTFRDNYAFDFVDILNHHELAKDITTYSPVDAKKVSNYNYAIKYREENPSFGYKAPLPTKIKSILKNFTFHSFKYEILRKTITSIPYIRHIKDQTSYHRRKNAAGKYSLDYYYDENSNSISFLEPSFGFLQPDELLRKIPNKDGHYFTDIVNLIHKLGDTTGIEELKKISHLTLEKKLSKHVNLSAPSLLRHSNTVRYSNTFFNFIIDKQIATALDINLPYNKRLHSKISSSIINEHLKKFIYDIKEGDFLKHSEVFAPLDISFKGSVTYRKNLDLKTTRLNEFEVNSLDAKVLNTINSIKEAHQKLIISDEEYKNIFHSSELIIDMPKHERSHHIFTEINFAQLREIFNKRVEEQNISIPKRKIGFNTF